MKRFLPTLLLALGCALQVNAATGLSSVIFTNLSRSYFDVDFTRTNNQIVKLRLDSSQFDTSGNTITIINVPVGSNPTIGVLPYKNAPNGFGDSALRYIDANTVAATELDVNDFGATNLVVDANPHLVLATPSGSLGFVSPVANGTGVLQNNGSGALTWTTIGGLTGLANPTALVGLTAVNGTATTAPRSDGAPALDQSIAPTWTSLHKFLQIGATLTVGNTTYVDMLAGSRTNSVSSALTLLYATNATDNVELTHVRWLLNSSGSDQTLTIPATWHTNFLSGVPTKLTNGTMTKMFVTSIGNTASAAGQTNVYVEFSYFK